MEQVEKTSVIFEKVLYVLQYYSVFQYPLSLHEIHSNCSILTSVEQIEKALKELQQEKKVFFYNGFYSNNASIKKLVERRIAGNKLADSSIENAVAIGRFIYSFPFVRFVGISGSLSKGFTTQEGDFDFFILTSKNRLWICRTLLHLFKKFTFLFGQEHKFCMNYFMDIAHAEVEEKNVYTAIELSSLLPVSGSDAYEHLMQQNRWIKSFLPNNYKAFYSTNISNKKYPWMRFWEIPLSLFGNFLNRFLMKLTDEKWKKKWTKKNYPIEDYKLAFKTTLYHSKNHPANHQKKILESLKRNAK